MDAIELGLVETARDRLIDLQSREGRVCRLEWCDPSFDVPPQVRRGRRGVGPSRLKMRPSRDVNGHRGGVGLARIPIVTAGIVGLIASARGVNEGSGGLASSRAWLWYLGAAIAGLAVVGSFLALRVRMLRRRVELSAHGAASIEPRDERRASGATPPFEDNPAPCDPRLGPDGREIAAGAARELRVPVLSLRDTIDALSGLNEGAREPAAGLLAAARREIGSLERLTADLRELGRPAGVHRVPCDLRDLLESSAEAARSGGGFETIAVSVHVPERFPAVALDRDRMSRLLAALLDNVRRHATGATRVRLTCAAEGGSVVLTVENDGGGVAPAILPRMFEPFVGRGIGAGLGLAVARRIVSDHGGSIEAISTIAGGTRVVVRLPIG